MDVARLAGVSSAVVSYVLNDGPRPVAPATKIRVMAAIQELNYRPNATARALKLARTRVIGMLVRDITNPYFSELAKKVQERAHESGYGLMVANAGADGVEETAEFQSILAHEVDGLAVYGIQRQGALSSLAASGLKVISLDWQLEGSNIPSVGIDVYGAGRDAVQHLLDHGFADIGLITGPGRVDLRETAWIDAMGIGEDPSRIDALREYSDFTLLGGYEAAVRLMSRPTPPRAIFASSDVQAFGAIRAVQALGLHVPDDVAIVSVDGTDASAFTFPSLTTIQLPFQEIADYIVEALIGPEPSFPSPNFNHVLVKRESCGCCPIGVNPPS